jgi:tetratricopeptide (TPR) repeat protein
MYTEGHSFEKALAVISRMESRMGYSSPVGFRKFQIYTLMGREAEAVEEVEKLIRQHPGDVRFLELLANTLRQQEDYDRAYKVYYRILEKDPEHATSLIALLNYYNQFGEREKMLDIAAQVINSPTINKDRKIQIHYQVFLREGLADAEIEQALKLARIIAEDYPETSAARIPVRTTGAT